MPDAPRSPPDASAKEGSGFPAGGAGILSDPVGRRVLLFFFLLYLITAKGWVESGDTWYSISTARAMLAGRLDMLADRDPGIPLANELDAEGRSYSKYGIGLALYLVPFVAAGRALATHVPAMSENGITAFLVSFSSIPFGLLILAAFWRAARRLGAGPASANLLTFGLGLGTLCWRYATSDFSEAAQAALLLLAVAGALDGRRRWAWIAGISGGGLVTFKLIHAILMPFLAAYFLLRPGPPPREERRRNLRAFLVPLAAALAALAILNFIRFGSPLESGYGPEAREFHAGQWRRTLPALLVSLDKGLLVFSPLLLLGMLAGPRFARRQPREAALLAALILANLLISAAWWAWEGGWCWGPRLLVPTVPLWLLPATAWLREPLPRWRLRVAAALIALSAVVQLPGVLVSYVMIESIQEDSLDAGQREQMIPMVPAAAVALWHKVTSGDDLYPVSLFGVSGDRVLDPGFSFGPRVRGLNLWTGQLARSLGRPWIRWIPLPVLLVLLLMGARIAGRTRSTLRLL